jgi:transglutaminase-like putative cysteine protease
MYIESNNLQDYLKKSEVINYDHRLIVEKCLELQRGTDDEISLIKKVYEFVRDEIHHSGDIGEMRVTCKASEVLEAGHGICCAKAHLFAAMLRYFEIPVGFCYQKLPNLARHGSRRSDLGLDQDEGLDHGPSSSPSSVMLAASREALQRGVP